MRILSIDPGDKTGIAVYVTSGQESVFLSWEIDDIDVMLHSIWRLLCTIGYDLVICEDFIINADTAKKKKPQRWPLEMKGAIRWMCLQQNINIIFQTPAQKDWMDDDKLKRIGWYKGTKAKSETAGHADDAARHIGVYLGVTRQDREFLRRLI